MPLPPAPFSLADNQSVPLPQERSVCLSLLQVHIVAVPTLEGNALS